MVIKDCLRYKKINFLIIMIASLLWYGVNHLINLIPNNFSKLIFFLFTLSLVSMILILLVNKLGVLILFYSIESILGMKIPDLESFKLEIIPILLIIGLIFELFFLIMFYLTKNKTLSKLISLSASNALIPLLLGLFISYNFLITNIGTTLNLFSIFFLANLAGSVFGFLIWHNIRSSKFMLRLEHKWSHHYN